jgi:lamin tail-like protein
MSVSTQRGWRRRFGFGAILSLGALAFWVTSSVPSPELLEPLMLNEILANPQRDWNGDAVTNSRDDEWVEIVNVGISPVALDGYRLAGADTSWRYGYAGTLNPGDVLVVYGSQSYAWETANGAPKFGLRLTNTGGTIGLWRLSESDTVLVDSYTYNDHEGGPDRSTGRLPDGGSFWRVFDALNPYTGTALPLGTGCMPSPGGLFQCPTLVHHETWGGLKRKY